MIGLGAGCRLWVGELQNEHPKGGHPSLPLSVSIPAPPKTPRESKRRRGAGSQAGLGCTWRSDAGGPTPGPVPLPLRRNLLQLESGHLDRALTEVAPTVGGVTGFWIPGGGAGG